MISAPKVNNAKISQKSFICDKAIFRLACPTISQRQGRKLKEKVKIDTVPKFVYGIICKSKVVEILYIGF